MRADVVSMTSGNLDRIEFETVYFQSIIIPFRNAARWLPLCLESVLRQSLPSECRVQLSAFDDSSSDASNSVCRSYEQRFRERQFDFVLSRGTSQLGVGGAKNRAVNQSNGRYLCFLDADDEMGPARVKAQLEAAKTMGTNLFIIGTWYYREPVESTPRYTRWANTLTREQLYTQVYTSFGPTILAPTWFCSRELFDAVGGFAEQPKTGFPEDLDFFYKSLRLGALLHRVDDDSAWTLYRYHPDCVTFSVHEDTIRILRVRELEERVIKKWSCFYIWNAGKGGRKFYKLLSDESKRKLVAFMDVDPKKIAQGYYEFAESPLKKKPRVPIISAEEARTPFVVCVKMDLTKGVLEESLRRLGFLEGQDYYFAS